VIRRIASATAALLATLVGLRVVQGMDEGVRNTHRHSMDPLP
jgi:hypothetical protein